MKEIISNKVLFFLPIITYGVFYIIATYFSEAPIPEFLIIIIYVAFLVFSLIVLVITPGNILAGIKARSKRKLVESLALSIIGLFPAILIIGWWISYANKY